MQLRQSMSTVMLVVRQSEDLEQKGEFTLESEESAWDIERQLHQLAVQTKTVVSSYEGSNDLYRLTSNRSDSSCPAISMAVILGS